MGMNALVKKVLAEVGIRPERFSLQWASAAEAPRFVKLITEFTREIKELGAIGETEGLGPEELEAKIKTAQHLVENRKLRMGFGNATKTIRKEGDFSRKHITEVIETKLAGSIASGLLEAGILTVLQAGPASLTSLVKTLGSTREQVEKILAAYSRQGKVEQQGKKWGLIET